MFFNSNVEKKLKNYITKDFSNYLAKSDLNNLQDLLMI